MHNEIQKLFAELPDAVWLYTDTDDKTICYKVRINKTRGIKFLAMSHPAQRDLTTSRSKKNIAKIRSSMENGTFSTLENTIKFDNKYLIDGNHRLAALVQADKEYVFKVVINYPPEIFYTLDRVLPRDELQVEGNLTVKYRSIYTRIINPNAVMLSDKLAIVRKVKEQGVEELIPEVLSKFPNKWVVGGKNKNLKRKSSLIAVPIRAIMCNKHYDKDDVFRGISYLLSEGNPPADELSRTNGIVLFRDYLLKHGFGGGSGKEHGEYAVYWSWDNALYAYLEGYKVTNIRTPTLEKFVCMWDDTNNLARSTVFQNGGSTEVVQQFDKLTKGKCLSRKKKLIKNNKEGSVKAAVYTMVNESRVPVSRAAIVKHFLDVAKGDYVSIILHQLTKEKLIRRVKLGLYFKYADSTPDELVEIYNNNTKIVSPKEAIANVPQGSIFRCHDIYKLCPEITKGRVRQLLAKECYTGTIARIDIGAYKKL